MDLISELDGDRLDLGLGSRCRLGWPDLVDFRYILLIYYLSFIDLVIDLDRVRVCDNLILLEYKDLIMCIRTCSILVIGIWIYRWLREDIYRWLEDQSRLIGRGWLLILINWDSDLLYQITQYELILDVHNDCIETVGW